MCTLTISDSRFTTQLKKLAVIEFGNLYKSWCSVDKLIEGKSWALKIISIVVMYCATACVCGH